MAKKRTKESHRR